VSEKPSGHAGDGDASEREAVAINKPESSIESAAITKSAALVVEVFLVASTETSFSYLYRRNHLRGAFTEDFSVAITSTPRNTKPDEQHKQQ
jgi:hypothetical protein